MFLPGGDDWSWSMYQDTAIDFCFHVLQLDGLRVAPFDQHADGDGSLREIGLDADVWRQWLGELINVHAQLHDSVWLDDEGRPHRREDAGRAEQFFGPWRLCAGGAILQAKLQTLWSGFDASDARRLRNHGGDAWADPQL